MDILSGFYAEEGVAENVRQAFKSNKLDGNTDECWDSGHSMVKEFIKYLPNTLKHTFAFEHENGKFQEDITFCSRR